MLTTFAFIESPFALGVIALVAILLFGHKLPGVAHSLGKSVSNFKKGVREGEIELEQDKKEPASVEMKGMPETPKELEQPKDK